MIIVYDSFTGNVKRFVNKIDKYQHINVKETDLVDEPFVLVTYTINFGSIPDTTLSFANRNQQYLRGIASSGNKVWGNNYAKAGDLLSSKFNVPLLCKFELSGNKSDVDLFVQEVDRIVASI